MQNIMKGLLVAAALLGGGIGVATHTTKLGLRYAIDTSPEPVTNGVSNIAELSVVGAIVLLAYTYPFKYWGLGEFAIFLIWGPIMIGGVRIGCGRFRVRPS